MKLLRPCTRSTDGKAQFQTCMAVFCETTNKHETAWFEGVEDVDGTLYMVFKCYCGEKYRFELLSKEQTTSERSVGER